MYVKLILRSLMIQITGSIHAKWLLRKRKDNYFMTDDKLQHIKYCAERAYPGMENDYSPCNTVEEYCTRTGVPKGELYVLTGDTWYLIVIRRPTHIIILDFASANGFCRDVVNVYKTLLLLFPNKRAYAKCRERTSYQLIRFFVRRGAYEILKDEITQMDGEIYHRVWLKSKSQSEISKRINRSSK